MMIFISKYKDASINSSKIVVIITKDCNITDHADFSTLTCLEERHCTKTSTNGSNICTCSVSLAISWSRFSSR